MHQTNSEKVKVLGEITAKFYDQTTLKPWQHRLNRLIEKIRKFNPGIMRHYQLGQLTFTNIHKNVICNDGFNAVCRRLTNDTTYTGIINKMMLGDGVGAAAATDHKLIHEVYRNNTASGTAGGNIAYLTAYFTETECSGTYKEFGNAIDGAAGADTGMIWSHLAGLNWVKTNTIALVVDCKYTFASI